jgi:hypothetical protein
MPSATPFMLHAAEAEKERGMIDAAAAAKDIAEAAGNSTHPRR